MSVVNIVLGAVLGVVSLIIVAFILLQEGRRAGISGAISGAADTFLSKNKARNWDAKLGRLTKYVVVLFFVIVIAANVVAIYFS
ncbi:MAG TPA: preprotein translocase subunit SecG [Ruminococcaceae bacterium]|nr:preprotein translocase subunit SecG [Oscillospiraceae bacterium]